MTSTLKVNTIQNACGADIIKESSNTITIGASGDTVTLGSGASQTGFGRTGTVDWQTTIKTAGFTASDGEGYFLNTNSGGFTVNLPAGTAGAIVAFKDYLNTWDTGNVTVSPNGTDKIGGVNADLTLSTESQSVTLIFTDSTRGWVDIHDSTANATGNAFISATGGTVTTSGNDKIHTFTGDGTFTVSKVACSAANNAVAYMVVGGGGYGSDYKSGSAGGGGAGGFREGRTAPITPYTASPLVDSAGLTVTATSFPIQVGAGSASGSTNGEPSIFSTITSTGGGRGAAIGGNAGAPYVGAPGGSGGGADGEGRAAGCGNTPPVNPAQGNNGGTGRVVGGDRAGAGGGGAGAVGVNGSSPQAGGAGGAGVSTEITGSAVTRAGGGGGQGQTNTAGAGGSGGGGAAGGPLCSAGNPGTINTGGGGGAGNKGTGSGTCGGQGGSGIVVIRYKFQ